MPTITLTVADEIYASLINRAAKANITIEEFILPLLDTSTDQPSAANSLTPPLTGDAWQAELEAWKRDAELRADRYPPGFVLDDTRESVYREREDAQA